MWAGTRGLRRDRDFRSRAWHRGAQALPAAIEEVPPEQRPVGANVAWIPGYWAWDDERNDYLGSAHLVRRAAGVRMGARRLGRSHARLSMDFRLLGRRQGGRGGILARAAGDRRGGSQHCGDFADHTWLPGCWVWRNGRYAWRPGFWATVQPNWVWVPAHYVWAPRASFVDGYWDYSVGRRGVLFAPCISIAGVYGRQGFSYTPTTVIDLGVFANHLFLRPRYQHYYFGDYYAANYRGAGFFPWFSFNTRRFGYDPIYAHQRWQHRQDRGWEQRQQADFKNRRDHENLRPPRTWAAQGTMDRALASESRTRVAAILDDLRRNKNNPLRFQPVDQSERQQFRQQAQEVQRFREERQKLETNATGARRTHAKDSCRPE